MLIKLTADCAECDSEMSLILNDMTGSDIPTINIYNFEQTEFTCKSCGKKYYTGDIDLLSEDEV